MDAFRIFFLSRDLEFFFFFFLLLLFPYFLINFSIESKKSFLFDMSLPFWYIRFKTHRLTKQRTIVLLLSLSFRFYVVFVSFFSRLLFALHQWKFSSSIFLIFFSLIFFSFVIAQFHNHTINSTLIVFYIIETNVFHSPLMQQRLIQLIQGWMSSRLNCTSDADLFQIPKIKNGVDCWWWYNRKWKRR